MSVKESRHGPVPVGQARDPAAEEAPRPSGYIEIEGASQHNLQNIDVKLPLGVFCSVTGVSGSGKSTLVNEVLFKAVANRLHRAKQRPGAHKRISGLDQIDKIINIDQSPIGRTPRSNPATYIGLFDHIRELYSRTQEARARGYKPGRFSFNVKGGRCEVCRGDGQIKIEMHFLPDVYVPCEQCHGKRYNRETLEVRFKSKTIADVLDMTVEEAVGFFEHIPKIKRKLQALHDVGLDYIRLGQPATTLSGGEAQRVKLASELSKVATGRTLYILDEPTTGLHFADVQRLLEMLNRLVDQGNTVVVIEHNLDVIKTSDRLIDLGPEGGEEGGRLVAQGTPEQVAGTDGSHTGRFLAEIVTPRQAQEARRAGEGARGGLAALREPAGPSASPPRVRRSLRTVWMTSMRRCARVAASISVMPLEVSARPTEQVTGPASISKETACSSSSKRSAQMLALRESVACSSTPNSSGPMRASSSTARRLDRSVDTQRRSTSLPVPAPWWAFTQRRPSTSSIATVSVSPVRARRSSSRASRAWKSSAVGRSMSGSIAIQVIIGHLAETLRSRDPPTAGRTPGSGRPSSERWSATQR